MPIEETKKAVALLEKFDLPVETLVINRLLPETVNDPFFLKKKEQEGYYLNIIENHFKGKHFIKIPLKDQDMNKSTIEDIAVFFE